MGLLVNGEWVDEWYDTKKSKGHFVRESSRFRHQLGPDKFPIEANRYHLFISHACPWAHRTNIFRHLKQLTDIISMSVVDPLMKEHGWIFKNTEDSIINVNYLHQLYTTADSSYTGRVTVPVLWDKKTNMIVNNESSEIIRMFNTLFNDLTGNNLDFYPENLRSEIDEINEFVYHNVNNGVYKVGFSTSQEVYESELKKLFNALDELDNRLDKTQYLVGSTLTEADWRLFTTLIRFDAVYVGHFKCNIRQIRDYKNLNRLVHELYEYPDVKGTINFDHIKTHYYASHTMINPTGIIPSGPLLPF